MMNLKSLAREELLSLICAIYSVHQNFDKYNLVFNLFENELSKMIRTLQFNEKEKDNS